MVVLVEVKSFIITTRLPCEFINLHNVIIKFNIIDVRSRSPIDQLLRSFVPRQARPITLNIQCVGEALWMTTEDINSVSLDGNIYHCNITINKGDNKGPPRLNDKQPF